MMSVSEELLLAEIAFSAARQKYHQALIAAFKWPVGTIIRSSKGEFAKIVQIYIKLGEVTYSAVLQNKDGTFGKREISTWRDEWRNATRVEE